MIKKQGIYILQSLKNSSYYIGSTIDLTNKLHEHKDGRVKSTKNLRPLKLVFFQKYDQIKLARRIEYKLKKLKRRDIIEKIINDGFVILGP